MKTFLLFSLFSLNALAGFEPEYSTQIDKNKTIQITVVNKWDKPIHCRWSVSWLDSLTQFNRFKGTLDVFPLSSEKLEFFNNPYSRVYRLKVKLDCL